MAITQAFSNSAKPELFQGIHVIKATGGDTIKIALFTSAATLGASTTTYTTSGESTGTGYTAGGNTLTVPSDPALSGSQANVTFAQTAWGPGATFNSDGAQIYNSTKANRSLGTYAFGSAKNPVNGSLTITFPAATLFLA